MTDRDKSSEGFLERWSRQKIDAERATPSPPADPEIKMPPPEQAPQDSAADAGAPAPTTSPPKPEFDLASLPSLDSITAATDVRPFLMPGVPRELARAALRRAWSADPAIRDFVGLAENAWDFTDPTAVAGFGDLPAGLDIKKLVAEVFGKKDGPTEQVSITDAEESRSVGEIAPPPPPNKDEPVASPERQQLAAASAQDESSERNNNIAAHNSDAVDEAEESQKRRLHGGALPH